jgi:putative DNA methylase
LPGKGSPKRDKGKVCPFGRKVIESKLKYGFGCPKSASRKECEDILCNTRLKPLIIQRFLRTVLTPKTEELVADPYRVGGKEKAAHFFESGMFEACKMAREYANTDYPLSIYYAYKQNENTKDEIDNTRTVVVY